MRIAIVTTFYPPYNFGGDGQYIRRFSHALAARGHEVEIIHESDAYSVLSNHRDLEPAPEPEGVTVHRLASAFPMGNTLLTQQVGAPLINRRRLQKILNSGFDVIHYHNISLVGGPGVLGIGSAIKLYTAHEHWLVCPMHILWKNNREVCTKRACLKCSIAHKRPPQLWRYTPLLKMAGRRVDAFLALSQFSAKKHADYGFPFSMRVTPSFLPTTDVSDSPQRERPYFLMVGRLEVIKGFQDVIPIFTDDSPSDLLIAGDGAFEDELRRLAVGRKTVKFLGRRTPEELKSLYRGARALIAPSRCYEVFPLVLLEAFQQETPAIARDLGPYPEIIQEANGGALFRDESTLREAISLMEDANGPRDEMGRSARKAFDERWNEDIAMETYFNLIDDIKENKSA